MPWLALIPAVLSIFGGIAGSKGGREQEKLGKEQELLAEQNALLAKQELQEQVRRQENEDARLQSKAVARAAASGARLSGSVASYLSYMEEEQDRQLEWTKTAGASRIRLQLAGDKLRARAAQIQGRTQSRTSLFSGLTSAFGFANAGGLFG